MWSTPCSSLLGRPLGPAILPGQACMQLPSYKSVRRQSYNTIQCQPPCCDLPRLSLGRTTGFLRQRGPHATSRFRARAQTGVDEGAPPVVTGDLDASKKADVRIKQTLADLDAILGIEDDGSPKKKKEEEAGPGPSSLQDPAQTMIAVSPDVIQQLAEAEAQRYSKGEKFTDEMNTQMNRIIDKAGKLGDTGPVNKETGDELLKEFGKLIELVKVASDVDKEDIKKLKEEVFGPLTFWVTSVKPGPEGGWLDAFRNSLNNMDHMGNVRWLGVVVNVRRDMNTKIQGNLRSDRLEVYDLVSTATTRLFGDKYEVLMLEDPEAEDEDPRGGPRIAFLVAVATTIRPPPMGVGRLIWTGLLVVATAFTAVQLGVVANISRLPPEVVEWLANPDALNGVDLPLSDEFDVTSWFLGAMPISVSVLAIQALHELGHSVVAGLKKIELGPPLLLPNSQLGTFGSITEIRSVPRTRKDLFDLSFAGPAVAAAFSLVLFVIGLSMSGADQPKEELLAVPAQLFQGSLLLGSIAKLALGDAIGRAGNVFVHPALIIGWCGLVTNALNCLPVGALDGGRMLQAAFGRSTLAVTSFLTYVGLALGFIGSSLALPFGIFVILFQRDPQRYIKDSVTEVGEARQFLAAGLITLALLVLLPMAPEVADSMNSSGGGGVPPNVFL